MKVVCNYAAKENTLKIDEKSDSLGPVCLLLGDLAQGTGGGGAQVGAQVTRLQ
jgi:hypothetical protein